MVAKLDGWPEVRRREMCGETRIKTRNSSYSKFRGLDSNEFLRIWRGEFSSPRIFPPSGDRPKTRTTCSNLHFQKKAKKPSFAFSFHFHRIFFTIRKNRQTATGRKRKRRHVQTCILKNAKKRKNGFFLRFLSFFVSSHFFRSPKNPPNGVRVHERVQTRLFSRTRGKKEGTMIFQLFSLISFFPHALQNPPNRARHKTLTFSLFRSTPV